MTTDELLRGLRGARSLLDRYEPDRRRGDWAAAAGDLAALRGSLDACSAELERVLDDMDDPAERESARAELADCHADAAALFAATGDASAAGQLLHRAVELGADRGLSAGWREAQADLDRFADLAYGRLLWRRGETALARPILKRVAAGPGDRLADEARSILDGPVPLKRPPSLFTLNGIGLTLVGKRDHREGSYVATQCFSILFVPIVPIAAYRVMDAGGGSFYFLAREKLSALARRVRLLVPLALVLLVAGLSIDAYLDSTSRRIGQALDAAGQLERAGELDRALGAYDRAIGEFFDEDHAADLRPAAAGIMRIAAARIATPAGAGSVEAIRRVVLRYQDLHPTLRSPDMTAALRGELIAWAEQIGGRDLAARRASLRVLELAAGAVSDADVGRRVDRARTRLAAELAGERPIEALRQYAAVRDRRATTEPTAAILASFDPGSSLWLEAEKEVEGWLAEAASHPAAAGVRGHLDEVRRRERDPGRAAVLGGDVAALSAAALANPRDHGVAVALARARRDAGELEDAITTLTALGEPGRMTAEAQAALGGIHADAGNLEEAERVLAGLITSELGAYQDAVSRYDRAASKTQASLIEKGQRGELPADVQAALTGASPEKQQEIGSAWLRKELEQDPQLSRLAGEVTARSHVVPAALTLGMVRLQMAGAADGEARAKLLAGAEAAFLSVRSQAEGRPEFHLGLGQVYYRLGRPADGERELARVLAEKDAQLRLQVGHVYRDLGLDQRAIEVAEAIWNEADQPVKGAAAHLRSLLAYGEEEEETWLARADQRNPFVRRSLTSLRAERKLREGDAAGADQLFAEVADEYGEEAARDSTAANNAAVAEGRRFGCNGDLAHLEKAATYMAQAYRLQPESAIVAGNLVAAWRTLAINRALGAWLDVRGLRPDYRESMTLLSVMAEGPDRARLRARLRGDAAFQRSNDLMRQWQILAPQNVEAYFLEVSALDALDDGPGIASLRERIARAGLNPSTDHQDWMSGSRDEAIRKETAAARARYERLLAAVRDKRTRAAAMVLLADRLRVEAMMGDAAAVYAERERLLAEAASLHRHPGVERALASARMNVAIMGAVAASPEVRALWEPRRRSHGWVLLTHLIAEASPGALEALRRQPQLAAAKAVFERELDERGQLHHWVLARALGDAAMETRAVEAMRGSTELARARVAALLRPDDPSAQETLALVERLVGP